MTAATQIGMWKIREIRKASPTIDPIETKPKIIVNNIINNIFFI
jgi:hypothetical protein